MDTLIICGTPDCNIDNIFKILQMAGLNSPNSSEKKHAIHNIDVWHDRLFNQNIVIDQGVMPGKAWQQAAGDIFLANWDNPLWGWADVRSTWLLDFWHEFDNNIKFLLLYLTPVEALVQAMLSLPTETPFNASDVLADWQRYSLQMQRFQVRHRKHSVMVSAHQALRQPLALIQNIETTLSIVLPNTKSIKTTHQATHLVVATLLAQRLLQEHPQYLTVAQEIEASVSWFESESVCTDSDIIDEFRQSIAQKRYQQIRLDEFQQKNEHLLSEQAKLAKMYAEQSQLADKRQQQIEQQKQQQLEIQQENELLLLQLHQVQEELEKTFLEQQSLSKKLQQEETQYREQTKLASERQKQIEQLNQICDQQSKQAQDDQQKYQQLEQVQQEIQQENELLLLQLHQVQEELEHYFLQHQEVQKQYQQLESRWQKLMIRYPDYCEWEDYDIAIDKTAKVKPTLKWRINGLITGAFKHPEVHFLTHLNQGRMSLIFERDIQEQSTLQRWPLDALDQNRITLQPEAFDDASSLEGQILRQLSTSDAQLVTVICNAGSELLQQSDIDIIQIQDWQDALNVFKTKWTKLPPLWRYDRIDLKREQVNPDYEHLWFTLHNVQYGERHWPTFEFRLSAALIQSGHFSKYPKLEFPQQDNLPAQFENWFAESSDDFGPKYELRFDLLHGYMDVEIWNTLSVVDQAQLISLITTLDHILTSCEMQDIPISRSWQDWQTLLAGLKQVMHDCISE